MQIYSVSLRFQSECRKIRNRKTPNTETFDEVNKTSFISLIICVFDSQCKIFYFIEVIF